MAKSNSARIPRETVDCWVARGWARWINRDQHEWRPTSSADHSQIAATILEHVNQIAATSPPSNLHEL